jgi:hypothetical protein
MLLQSDTLLMKFYNFMDARSGGNKKTVANVEFPLRHRTCSLSHQYAAIVPHRAGENAGSRAPIQLTSRSVERELKGWR